MKTSVAFANCVAVCGSLLSSGCSDINETSTQIRSSYKSLSIEEENLLVYESKSIKTNDGDLLQFEEVGELTPEIIRQAARPWGSENMDQPYFYHEESSTRSINNGNSTETIYKLWRSARPKNPPVAAVMNGNSTPHISSQTRLFVDTKDIDEDIFLVAKISNFPDWNIPLIGSPYIYSVDDYEHAKNLRADAIQKRKNDVVSMSNSVKEWLGGVGGSIQAYDWVTGSIEIKIKKRDFEDLANRNDIASLETSVDEGSKCDLNCNLGASNSWRLGEGHLSTRFDSNRFLDAGYNGAVSNPSRHTHGNIVISIVEAGSTVTLEDEWCGFSSIFSTSSDCMLSSRIGRIGDCDSGSGGGCNFISNYNDSDATSSHATLVASIAAGDFTDNQGNYWSFGDSCFATGDGVNHCSDWEQASTGMAPESQIHFYGGFGSGLNTAIGDVITQNSDVLNISFASNTYSCDPSSNRSREEAVENAFDDGVFVVAAAGNDGAPGLSSCHVDTPADTPKAFTVSGLDSSVPSCIIDYQSCDIDSSSSSLGGADVSIDGTVQQGALTMIDLVAPARVSFFGEEGGNEGFVRDDGTLSSGTSSSTPHVSGAAVLVKDWLLTVGNSWINNPGRLHTVMLAMGDDWVDPSQGRDASGFGRLKLRLLQNNEGMDPWGYSMKTYTLTNSSPNYMLFNEPFPTGTDYVKCVMFEAQDLISSARGTNESTDNDDFSDVYLTTVLRSPVGGTCSSSGIVDEVKTDGSFDTKHIVSYNSPEDPIAGRCLQVDIKNVHLAEASLTVNVFCYYSGVKSHEPN